VVCRMFNGMAAIITFCVGRHGSADRSQLSR
jgi:hypothetical protein